MERDEHIFAYVMDELEDGIKNEALWIKAFSVAEGEENKHKALYLQYRVEEIKSIFKNNNIDYIECSKDKINEYSENDFKDELVPEWMKKLWEWADENNIPDLEDSIIGGDPDYWENWTGIPRDSKKLANLKKLHLSWYDMDELPKEIGNLISLEQLNISRFQNIKELPKEIGRLKNLKQLDISWNDSLIKLPKEIGNLSNLEELELANNKNLRTLPKEIGNLSKLNNLEFCTHVGDGFLGCTIFDSFPEELSNLTNLKHVRMHWQNENDIPDGLFDISALLIESAGEVDDVIIKKSE